MTHSDIGSGLRLCRAARWNQLEEDWRFFLESPGSGGFVAEQDGAVVGTSAFLRYGADFSWISMMLVDPAMRRGGVGSLLLESALEALADEASVRLDATPAGEPLYRKYGFAGEYELLRTKAVIDPDRFEGQSGLVRTVEPGDLPAIFAMDAEVFGARRDSLLESVYQHAPKLAWVAHEGAQLVGYCFGRLGYLYTQLGPVVAHDLDTARELVSHALAAQAGVTVAIDAPQASREWIEWLQSAGFDVERTFLRMYRGQKVSASAANLQFAITGPEFG